MQLGPLPVVGSGSVERPRVRGRLPVVSAPVANAGRLSPADFFLSTLGQRRAQGSCPSTLFPDSSVHRRASVLSVDVTISWLWHWSKAKFTNTSFDVYDFGVLYQYLHRITRASLDGDWLGLSISGSEEEKGNNARCARNYGYKYERGEW